MLIRIISKLAMAGAALAMVAPAEAQKRPVRAAAPVAPTAPAARQQLQPQLPTPEAMIILIRATLVALSQANVTNNYTVLNGLGSPAFRTANPPVRLAQTFEAFRTNHIDMNPVVFVTPQLTQQPLITNGKMRLAGYFPTQPMQVNYDLTFEPSDGVWRLFGLSVNLTAPGPAR